MAKYKYKIIIEVSPEIMQVDNVPLGKLITTAFPQIEGLLINYDTNEIEWHQGCGIEANDVKKVLNKL